MYSKNNKEIANFQYAFTNGTIKEQTYIAKVYPRNSLQ